MNLYVVSLLSAVALGFRADVQYQRVDAIDPAERRKMVESFGKFKAILATNQSRFLKDCAKASDYISDVLSCGNTVLCYSRLFTKDPLVLKKNLKIGKKNVEKALKNVKSCLSTPLDYMYLDYVTLGLWKRVQDLVRHTDLGNQSPGALSHGSLERKFLQARGGRNFLIDVAQASLDSLKAELLRKEDPEDLPRVFFAYLSWSTVGTWRSQNHLFAIVKRSNTNFHIMQGYIKSDVEPGYDLSDWLCSRNPFANINGFGAFSMHKFLDHLDTFIDNGHEGDTFDGDNHAAMFLVREKNFEGKEYVPAFAWFEVEQSDMNSDQDIALMVKSATSQAQAVPLEEQCQDLEKIHEGKLLPGETLKARPGALAALRSDRPEDWTLEQQTSSEVFARDMRQTDEEEE